MDAEQKKALITARLAERLREVGHRSVYRDVTEIARLIMDGEPTVSLELTRTHDSTMLHPVRQIGLWETIAPTIDSLAVRDVIEVRLRGHEGEPLSRSVLDEILRGIDRVLDSMSGTEPMRLPTSRVHRSTGVWGGGGGGKMMPADYEKDRGGD